MARQAGVEWQVPLIAIMMVAVTPNAFVAATDHSRAPCRRPTARRCSGGGSLWVFGGPGCGSTFRVNLPVTTCDGWLRSFECGRRVRRHTQMRINHYSRGDDSRSRRLGRSPR